MSTIVERLRKRMAGSTVAEEAAAEIERLRAELKQERQTSYQGGLELAAEIERLRGLLADPVYIQCKADYNRGHLSHANYLAMREANP